MKPEAILQHIVKEIRIIRDFRSFFLSIYFSILSEHLECNTINCWSIFHDGLLPFHWFHLYSLFLLSFEQMSARYSHTQLEEETDTSGHSASLTFPDDITEQGGFSNPNALLTPSQTNQPFISPNGSSNGSHRPQLFTLSPPSVTYFSKSRKWSQLEKVLLVALVAFAIVIVCLLSALVSDSKAREPVDWIHIRTVNHTGKHYTLVFANTRVLFLANMIFIQLANYCSIC